MILTAPSAPLRVKPSQSTTRTLRATSLLLYVGLAAVTIGGCASYSPKPLNPAAIQAEFHARTPVDTSVRAFASRLNQAESSSLATFDPTDGLTLAEAEPVALVFNPALRVARLEANVTRAAANHAGRWEDPVLGADFERIVSGAKGANPWVVGSSLSLTLPLSGRLTAEKVRATAQADADLDRVIAQEWATRAALRELWLQWSAALLRVELAESTATQLNEAVNLADRQQQAGSLTRIDARLLRIESAGRAADLIELRSHAEELRLAILSMLGLAPQSAVKLMPSLAFALPAAAASTTDPLAATANPELAAIQTQYAVAEAALKLEIRKQYPDLTIGPGYATDQGDDRATLGLSLPLPIWNRNAGGVARATAEREAAQGRFESAFEQLATSLASAKARYDSAVRQLQALEATVIPLTDEQEADVRRVSALGRLEPLLMLETLKAQHAAKLRLVEAQLLQSLSAARLAELLGPPACPQAPATPN